MPFQIVKNDIEKMQVEAIVCAFDPMRGDGIRTGSVIYKAACKDRLPANFQDMDVIERGSCAISKGHALPAKSLIQTAGMTWQGGTFGEEEVLHRCYRSIFHLVIENRIESVAMTLFASETYGYPKEIAIRIALSEIKVFLAEHDMELYLVLPDEKAVSLPFDRYSDIENYIRDNYVAVADEDQAEKDNSSSAYAGLAYKEIPSEKKSGFGISTFMKGNFLQAFGRNRSEVSVDRKTCKKGENGKKAESRSDFARELPEAERRSALAKESLQAEAQPMLLRESASVKTLSRTLDDVVKNLDKSFMELVFSFADAKGMSDVEVQKKANLDRKAFSKLKCGTTKNPSKPTALALAIALELSLDETKDLLSRAGLALSPCSRQDLIVQYFIEREAYDIYEINVALFEHGEPLLGAQSF